MAASAAGPGRTSRPSAEPSQEALAPVERDWEGRGWKAVVPHAYVLKRLLPALTIPKPRAAPVFWVKGGTRVPVLEQGREWWKIGWTEGRTGWVRARDVEPHASFILMDTRTGKVQRRLAAKGQLGALSDGKHLWSISNSGITRTLLGERPALWSRAVAADRDAPFPDSSLWTPERSHFYVRSQTGETGPLLRAAVATGGVEAVGTPPAGRLAGLSGERLIIIDSSDGNRAHLYDPETARTLRRVPAGGGVVSRTGATFLTRDQELLRCNSDLRQTHRVRLPYSIDSVSLSIGEEFVAVTGLSNEAGYGVRIYRADTLRLVISLELPEEIPDLYLQRFGKSARGWWLVGNAEGRMALVARFTSRGKFLGFREAMSPATVSADGSQAYLSNEDEVLVVDTATGRSRKFPLTWRRSLPAHYIPKPTMPEFPTHPEVSSLALSPDGHTLIVTEWLSGDPSG